MSGKDAFEFWGICASDSSYSERVFIKAEGITVTIKHLGLEKSITIEGELEYWQVVALMNFM